MAEMYWDVGRLGPVILPGPGFVTLFMIWTIENIKFFAGRQAIIAKEGIEVLFCHLPSQSMMASESRKILRAKFQQGFLAILRVVPRVLDSGPRQSSSQPSTHHIEGAV